MNEHRECEDEDVYREIIYTAFKTLNGPTLTQHTEPFPLNDQWLSRECILSSDDDGTEADGVNGRSDEEHPRPHYS